MRLIHLFCVTMLFLPLFGGCSVARLPMMYSIGMSEVPVVPGGKARIVSVMPLVAHPTVKVEVVSPLGVEETVAWYQDQLVRRGWVLDRVSEGDRTEWLGSAMTPGGGSIYLAKRRSWKAGKDWLNEESLDLEFVRYDEGHVTVQVTLDGTYAWDRPSLWVYDAVVVPVAMGVYGMGNSAKGTAIGALCLPLVIPVACIDFML